VAEAQAHRTIDRALRVVAAGLLASLAVACWHDVSKAWDVWYYHLPFAGRLAGLVGADTFPFGRSNQARFDGFPLFGELVQGLLWRVTGRPECASFFALAALPGLAWLLKRLFAVPPHLAVIAFLAVPLVQIHATACYVDLTANAFVVMLALLGFRQLVSREPPSLAVLASGSVLAAAAANTKFQLVPAVLAAAAVLVLTALRRDPRRDARPNARARRLAVIALALPLVFATPLKNVARHGNPVWPVELHVLGTSLPHLEGAYASSPTWLETVPRPVRWAASVLELGLDPVASHGRWSIDQWKPPAHRGYRMGGFFGAYVVANLVALVAAVFVRRSREARLALLFMGGATVVASLMPQSHELRYYLFWMLLLVSLNLVVWSRDREHDLRAARATTALALVASAALLVVAWSTEGTYLYPSGDSFAELVAAKVDHAALERIAPGERVCVPRQPWTFLYAARFHPGRRYVVQEAEGPEECAGARVLE
jgi:hypothetical protein